MYYRNAQAALVVYDLTKPSSLVKARHWVAELQRQASPGIVIALCGNKLDLCGEDNDTNDDADEEDATTAAADDEEDLEGGSARKVGTKEAKAYADEENLLFFETSAKQGTNVSDVFTAIANAIPETSLKGPRGAAAGGRQAAAGGDAGNDSGRVNLNAVRDAGAKEGCAC